MWMFKVILSSHVSFTNLKCESIDREFGNFEICRIKAVNRSHKYIDLEFKITKLPLNEMVIKVEPMRYNNGYRPVLSTMKVDFCKYMKNPNARSSFLLKEFHATFINSTNLNHTCPYNNDISIKKLWTGNLEKGFLQYLPVPHGDYVIHTTWYSRNIRRVKVSTFFKIT
ncbi:uncharacterized protein LOC108113889 [Drosophila eugracilis]|uniref:uncharacterized protein LOC108113889 n=1 Tax=Drosophila eugracilis TaxID=29029 RepID=UPI0007E82721|nr:uncharacterized protein LOC108113889 [Drosophila eugracilis]